MNIPEIIENIFMDAFLTGRDNRFFYLYWRIVNEYPINI